MNLESWERCGRPRMWTFRTVKVEPGRYVQVGEDHGYGWIAIQIGQEWHVGKGVVVWKDLLLTNNYSVEPTLYKRVS